ncbi:hypothetical protein EPR50_G00020290 [Perca flavescens]|uniref:BTB domain-containing protein n=1 Tax=Perca flavescens TaxID=8167 RepID=A0A484DMR2_PERFV|nr:uncharacterized protein LOC114573562 [Perca flavescens]TDH16532.1 hypothetical protein EPR50_G00020290 [Perca flavescens]
MQRYRWPGFKMQLLGELQRQQNNAQFCDTLLQTEGISVPTHSCILAALSPYLSQKLSASPSPPSGQKRQIQLQALKAQTLLKLVALLYSGKLEVKGSGEQNDVLSAARQLGITDLVEGQEKGGGEEGEPQENSLGCCREKAEAGGGRNESGEMQDAQVQTEMAEKRDTDSPIEKRSCVSTGTQTVRAGEKMVGSSSTQSGQTKPPTPEPACSEAQSLGFSMSVQCPDVTHDKHLFSTPCLPFSSMHSGARSDGQSTLDRSSDSVTNPTSTSALPSSAMTLPISLNNDSNAPTPQEDGANQQSSEVGDSVQVFTKEGTGLEDGETNGKTAEHRTNIEQPSNRDEMLGKEKGKPTGRRRTHFGIKNMAKMKRMQTIMNATQISVKVKLRRRTRTRTKGEVWEVVSIHDRDESLSVLTSLKQDGSNHKRPQASSEPPPSSVEPGLIHKPETQNLQPAPTDSPEPPPPPPPHSNTTSVSKPLSSDCFAPNQNDGVESVPLPQPPGPAEECDEQIEKLLEDIMMGLNILPNLDRDRDCKKSHYPQPIRDGAPAICQVPVTENEQPQSPMHAAVSAAGCVYYQDFGTQIGHSSTDAGIYCYFTAQNQPSCSSLSSLQPAAVLIQQQQPSSPQYHSSVPAVGERDGTSPQDMPLSKSLNCPYPEAPTTSSVLPTALYSSDQKLLTTVTYYPACQDPSSQVNENILQFLPLTNENGGQSLYPLPCMDDLRLPPCLSPLEQSPSAAEPETTLNDSPHQRDKIPPQPSLHGRPWLTLNHGPLQFPLSAITQGDNKSALLPQDTNLSCRPKQRPKRLELSLRKKDAASWTVEERGAISAGHQNVSEVKLCPVKMKESLESKQSDTQGDATASKKKRTRTSEGDAAAPKKRKRKSTSPLQEASSLLAYQHVKVIDGTKGQINLSVCSVSLSSNNVLAKEREMAASSSNGPHKFAGKPNDPSTITESQKEKTRGPGDLNTDRTRVSTRAFLKKTQEMPSNSGIEHVLKPIVHKAQVVNEPGVFKRGPGRPRKNKVEESPPESSPAIEKISPPAMIGKICSPAIIEKMSSPAIIEKISHNLEKSGLQIDSNLLKEESAKTKRECRKWRRNRREVEEIPLKKAVSAESPVEAQADDKNDVTPEGKKRRAHKRPRRVTLKEFEKLIKRQHSRTRKSQVGRDKKTSGTARDAESEGKACGSRFEELTKQTELDIAQPQNTDGIKESFVLFHVKSDKNHNHISYKSQQDDPNCSTSKETSLFGDGSHPVSSFDVSGDKGAKPLKDPDKAQKACDTGTTQQTAIKVEGSSHRDTYLPQEDKRPLEHDLKLRTPETTGPPRPQTVGFSKSSGCDQAEDEEEEEEVDVLLYSPDKVLQTRECENGLVNMEMTPEEEEEEEEEEEDVNEIDVTGDEAE